MSVDIQSSWHIGPVEIPTRIVLAPMAGVSVQAFRRQGRRFGAGLVCSEMVSCAGLSHGNERTLGYLRIGRDERPLAFFGLFALLFGAIGLALGGSVVIEYMETRLVPRFPTAILATGLMLLSFLALGSGLILHNVARGQREIKRLAYLAAGASSATSPALATSAPFSAQRQSVPADTIQ